MFTSIIMYLDIFFHFPLKTILQLELCGKPKSIAYNICQCWECLESGVPALCKGCAKTGLKNYNNKQTNNTNLNFSSHNYLLARCLQYSCPLGKLAFLKITRSTKKIYLHPGQLNGPFLEPCEKCENRTNHLPQAFN